MARVKQKRLIDGEQLKTDMYLIAAVCNTENIFIDAIIDQIDNADDVDAVEVIRCKDCKKWYRHTQIDRERGECRRYETTKHENGYCDRAERKDND